MPGVNDLRDELRENFSPHENFGEFSEDADLLLIADQIIDNEPRLCLEVQQFVAGYFDEKLADREPGRVARDLVNVPSRLIITLNYDGLLEKAARDQGMNPVTMDSIYDLQAFERLARSATPPDELTILHLHGSTLEPHTIVLDSSSYRRLAGVDDAFELLGTLISNRRLCFLGTRLNEIHIQEMLLRSTGRAREQHPIFIPRSEIAELRSRLTEGSRYSVHFCEMPSRNHLVGLAKYLRRPEDTPESGTGTGAPAGPIAPGPSAGYVRTQLAECDDDRDDATLDFLSYFNDFRRVSTSSPAEHTISEENVALGHRNLVVGVPGSGKSELLRYAAQLVPETRTPVLIRLGDLPPDVADPRRQFQRWLERGEPFREGASLGQATTFHVFLDGLDEVAPYQQDRYANQIVRLADAHPQHAFTVASRPVEATSIFPRDAWECFRLVPGGKWQSRYLESRGVNIVDIVSSLEGGDAIVELLRLPFFLVRAVDLYEAGGLEGRNLWSVVRNLVDDALRHEEDRLPVDVSSARQWLQKVSLSLSLSDRTSLQVEELGTVPLSGVSPEELEEICEALVQRAMLQKRDEGFVFVHQIIGESLTAEALLDLGPREELLEAIAPRLSEQVRGVRPDWRVPLSFLLPNSPDWLAAVKDRDPMHWARSVPDSADIEERREAAELLWTTYLEWRIWIWDYTLPDIVQDGPSLSRHIRAGGLESLVDQIFEAIDDSSAQVQGNAIRVLAEANVRSDDLKGALALVLDDEGRLPVVRRQAAIVASDRNFHDLLPQISTRALMATDSAEAQDFAAAALSLAVSDELEAQAIQLLENHDTRSVVIGRLNRMLNPPAALRVLRRYSRIATGIYSLEKNKLLDAIDALDDPTPDDVENATYAAVNWGMEGAEFTDLITSHRESALRGAQLAISEMAEPHWWFGRDILSEFSAEELEAAGFGREIVERRRSEEEIEAQTQEEPRVRQIDPDPEARADQPARLSQILTFPPENSELAIQNAASDLASQVESLGPDEKDDLRSRLSEWWDVDARFDRAISWGTRSPTGASWTIENWANAWMWFGPALNMELTPRQWAEIAVSGALFEQQHEWLQSQSTTEGQNVAAEICSSNQPRIWYGVIRGVEGPLTSDLVDAIVTHLGQVDRFSFEMEGIVQRLVEDGFGDALSRLLNSTDALDDMVLPHLAAAGDAGAISAQFERLVTILAGGRRPRREDLFWLDGVSDERYLPQLFESLILANSNPDLNDPFWSDAVTPILNAIQIIGGEAALAGFDRLLGTTDDPNLLFLRLRRDKIAEAELTRLGTQRAGPAAEVAGVPILPPI